MPHHLLAARKIISLFLCLLLISCSAEDDSPEAQLRQFIDNAVAHAEKREHAELSAMIAADYRDQKGLNKQKILSTLGAYSIRHRNIYMLSKIESIELQSDNRAFLVVYVAMTGNRVNNISSLTGLSARIYRFELQLIKNEHWQLQQAAWKKSDIQKML